MNLCVGYGKIWIEDQKLYIRKDVYVRQIRGRYFYLYIECYFFKYKKGLYSSFIGCVIYVLM